MAVFQATLVGLRGVGSVEFPMLVLSVVVNTILPLFTAFGLGLAIAKQIIEGYNGRVWATECSGVRNYLNVFGDWKP